MNARNRELIEAELEKITERDGNLKPSAVVDQARDPNNPLHSEFEWDNTKAAEKFRIEQARKLIRSVTVVTTVEHHEIVIPRYVRDPEAEPQEQGFTTTLTVRDDIQKAKITLQYEIERMEAIIKRTRGIAEVLGLDKVIDDVFKKIIELKNKTIAA